MMNEFEQKKNALLYIESIIEESSYNYASDETALDQMFNDVTDQLCKDGELSEEIYNEWSPNSNERYALLYGNVSDLRDYQVLGA